MNAQIIQKIASLLLKISREDRGVRNHLGVLGYLLFLKKQDVVIEIHPMLDQHHRDVSSYVEHISHNLIKDQYIIRKIYEIIRKEFELMNALSLGNLIQFLNNEVPGEFAGEIFEEIINQYQKNVSKKEVELTQPKEVTDFVQLITGQIENQDVFNPFAGYAFYGLSYGKTNNYYGQEVNPDIWAIGSLRLILNDVSPDSFMLQDSFNELPKNKFDLIVSTPPWGYKIPKGLDFRHYLPFPVNQAEEFVISYGIQQLSHNGKLIVIVPDSLLYRNTGTSKYLREFIIEEDFIEMIISLPPNVFYHTGIRTSILVINKSKYRDNRIVFVNGETFIKKQKRENVLQYKELWKVIERRDEVFVREVSKNDIINNSYLLNVNRYFLEKIEVPKGHKEVLLKDLIASYHHKPFEEKTGRVVSVSSLSDNPYDYILDISELPYKSLDKLKKVTDPVLLLARRRQTLKPTYCIASLEQPIYIPSSIIAYKVKEDLVDISFLINQFYSEYLQKQIRAISTGSVLASIGMTELMRLTILLPSLDEQRNIISGIREVFFKANDRKQDLEKYIAILKKEYQDELHMKKHTLAQYVNNLQSSVSSLMKFMGSSNGTIASTDFISSRNKITVEEHLNGMFTTTKDIGYFVDRLPESLTFEKGENIDLDEFMKLFKRTYSTDHQFKLSYVYDKDSFKENGRNIKPLVSIASSALKEILNNIIENAKKHGFVDERSDYKVNVYLTYDFQKENIKLDIQNNGKGMPKGMNTFRYGLKNEKAGLTGNRGFGGYKVKQAIEYYKGEFEIYSDENNEFPVTVSLYLPLIKE